ncbi:hypothetical protein PsYK624_168280 [Phanerochaete sordida]|uniref:Uncharacterized protein n=1 Tax=Phanerochaete sordida TaxID=48140 RepID=A0A9P3GXT1_9APHY|nr:hypothetical protein PsYK624_168280 [Phanerochaete sordida]
MAHALVMLSATLNDEEPQTAARKAGAARPRFLLNRAPTAPSAPRLTPEPRLWLRGSTPDDAHRGCSSALEHSPAHTPPTCATDFALLRTAPGSVFAARVGSGLARSAVELPSAPALRHGAREVGRRFRHLANGTPVYSSVRHRPRPLGSPESARQRIPPTDGRRLRGTAGNSERRPARHFGKTTEGFKGAKRRAQWAPLQTAKEKNTESIRSLRKELATRHRTLVAENTLLTREASNLSPPAQTLLGSFPGGPFRTPPQNARPIPYAANTFGGRVLMRQIEDATYQLDALSDTITRVRSGLVQELVEVFSVVEVGRRLARMADHSEPQATYKWLNHQRDPQRDPQRAASAVSFAVSSTRRSGTLSLARGSAGSALWANFGRGSSPLILPAMFSSTVFPTRVLGMLMQDSLCAEVEKLTQWHDARALLLLRRAVNKAEWDERQTFQ